MEGLALKVGIVFSPKDFCRFAKPSYHIAICDEMNCEIIKHDELEGHLAAGLLFLQNPLLNIIG